MATSLDTSSTEVYIDVMPRPPMHSANRPEPRVDYTSRAYWNGIIKMSLSKFFMLCVLHERPMHGYEIARAVGRTSGGCCSPAEGTIYPVLREFEDGGYVTATTEVVQGRERKVYALTQRGREAFVVAVDAWMEVTRCLQEGCAVRSGNDGACRPCA